MQLFAMIVSINTVTNALRKTIHHYLVRRLARKYTIKSVKVNLINYVLHVSHQARNCNTVITI